MSASLIDTLPLPQRLALTYAPGKVRSETLALFALDARLGQALRQTNEPIMAQMRLAWWRDQLKLDPPARERSDELVCLLDIFDTQREALAALVDGWELLLTEDFAESAASAFASARAQALLGLARIVEAPDSPEDILLAGQTWALADLAASLSDPSERAAARGIAPQEQAQAPVPSPAPLGRAQCTCRAKPGVGKQWLARIPRQRIIGYASGAAGAVVDEAHAQDGGRKPMNRVVLGALGALVLVAVGLFWWQGRAQVEQGAPPPSPAQLAAAPPSDSLPAADIVRPAGAGAARSERTDAGAAALLPL